MICIYKIVYLNSFVYCMLYNGCVFDLYIFDKYIKYRKYRCVLFFNNNYCLYFKSKKIYIKIYKKYLIFFFFLMWFVFDYLIKILERCMGYIKYILYFNYIFINIMK